MYAVQPLTLMILLSYTEANSKGCLNWKRQKDKHGYGFQWDPTIARSVYAHRLAYELKHGCKLDPSQKVLHDCDNPSCINPDHLTLGTQADNLKQMKDRGRGLKKLTLAQIESIRAEYVPRKVGSPQLAAKYGVSATYIQHILKTG